MAPATNSKEKLSLSFHRGFALYRSGVQAVLSSALLGNRSSTNDVLENTTLGTSQAEAMPRYAERAGLLDGNKQPTLFGRLAGEYDESLSRPSTQWVMHYYLSAPYRFRPNFWNFLVNQLHSVGQGATTGDIKNLVGEFATAVTGNESSSETLDVAVSGFVGTYTRADSLGSLGLFTSPSSGQYVVTDPNPMGAGAFACVLADYWDNVWTERDTVLLHEVTQGPLARLLRAEGTLGDSLRSLEKRGLVRLQRRTSPFSVTRMRSDVPSLWREQLYFD